MDRNTDSNLHNRYAFIQITINTDKRIDCCRNYIYRDRWQPFRFRLRLRKRLIERIESNVSEVVKANKSRTEVVGYRFFLYYASIRNTL